MSVNQKAPLEAQELNCCQTNKYSSKTPDAQTLKTHSFVSKSGGRRTASMSTSKKGRLSQVKQS